MQRYRLTQEADQVRHPADHPSPLAQDIAEVARDMHGIAYLGAGERGSQSLLLQDGGSGEQEGGDDGECDDQAHAGVPSVERTGSPNRVASRLNVPGAIALARTGIRNQRGTYVSARPVSIAVWTAAATRSASTGLGKDRS